MLQTGKCPRVMEAVGLGAWGTGGSAPSRAWWFYESLARVGMRVGVTRNSELCFGVLEGNPLPHS